jgi:hypothetical protein
MTKTWLRSTFVSKKDGGSSQKTTVATAGFETYPGQVPRLDGSLRSAGTSYESNGLCRFERRGFMLREFETCPD